MIQLPLPLKLQPTLPAAPAPTPGQVLLIDHSKQRQRGVLGPRQVWEAQGARWRHTALSTQLLSLARQELEPPSEVFALPGYDTTYANYARLVGTNFLV